MSYPYPERWGGGAESPYGSHSPDLSNMPSPNPGRRPAPPHYDPRHMPAPLRPSHQGGGQERTMHRPSPPQQYQQRQYAQSPRSMDRNENLYDGSAYGGADEFDQWPLPSAPFAREEQRSRSPNSGRGSPAGSPRRPPPPHRPQRPDYRDSDPVLEPPPRSASAGAGRIAPANRAYHQAPPPSAHHGSGQWTGDGYSAPQPYPPSRPPRDGQQTHYVYQPDFQASRDAAYGQRSSSTAQRPPLGPPPSSRRGPASYYPQIAPVHPIAEETDSMRGSIRSGFTNSLAPGPHASMAVSHSSYGSTGSNAIPIGIPDYYLKQQQPSGSPLVQQQSRGDDGVPSYYGGAGGDGRYGTPPPPGTDRYDDSPIEYDSGRDSPAMFEQRRDVPSPEPPPLIRQASLGKKTKPTLTTVKSVERVRKDTPVSDGLDSLPSQRPQPPPQVERGAPGRKAVPIVATRELGLEKDFGPDDSDEDDAEFNKAAEAGGAAAFGAAAAGAVAQRSQSSELLPDPKRRSSDVLSSGTGLMDASSSESEKEVKKVRSKDKLSPASTAKEKQQQGSRSIPRSPLAPPTDDFAFGDLQTGQQEGNVLKSPKPGLSANPSRRRPPKLAVDVDAVRDAEARGSLTSLSDLIKRATKLASNLDRGKTASRLGMNFLEGSTSSEQLAYKRALAIENANRRSNGSLTDMLSNFPPPGVGTPTGSRGEMTRWSSNLRHEALPSESDAGEIRKGKRKCCGMPLWLFLLLLILLICLVAAAVVVPVVLIVIPRMNQSTGNHNLTSKSLASCQNKISCDNGGTNVISNDGSCRCLCVNGYTGSTCSTLSKVGCTKLQVAGTKDVTVGTSIPDLLQGAQKDFGVPLDSETIVSLFSAADMTCASENALVQFDNKSSSTQRKRRDAQHNGPPRHLRHSTVMHQRSTTRTANAEPAATSNGVVYESGRPKSAHKTTTSSSPQSSQTSSSPPSSGSSTKSVETKNFAATAVLYILQISGQANVAAVASDNLRSYFTTGETANGHKINPTEVDLGNGYSCNLDSQTVILVNGTRVGGG